MNTLLLSKKDTLSLLIASALLPTLCFIAGLYVANSFNTSNTTVQTTKTIPLTQHTPTNPEPANTVVLLEQPQNEKKISDEIEINDGLSEVIIPPLTTAYYVVQAGLFSNHQNAIQFQHGLLSKGIENHILASQEEGRHLYRIILNSFKSQDDAIQFQNNAKEKHNLDLYVTHINITDINYLKTFAAL